MSRISDALHKLISAAGGTPSGSTDIAECIEEYAEAIEAAKQPEGGS